MADVVFVAGLGDRADYIEKAVADWPEHHSLTTTVLSAQWEGPLDSGQEVYEQLKGLLNPDGSTAVVGISAGGSLALNALRRYPEQISCGINLCGTTRIRPKDENDKRLMRSPRLRQAARELETNGTIPERTLTLRPLYEMVVNPKNVSIEGADNRRLLMFGHVTTILWALYVRDHVLVDFIKQHNQR